MRRLHNFMLTKEEMTQALRMLLVLKGVTPPRDMVVTQVGEKFGSDGSTVLIQAEAPSFNRCAAGIEAMCVTPTDMLHERQQRIYELRQKWAKDAGRNRSTPS